MFLHFVKCVQQIQKLADYMEEKIKINKKKSRQFGVHISEGNKQIGNQTTNTLKFET